MDSWLKAAVSEVQKSATQLAQDVKNVVADDGSSTDLLFGKGPLGFTLDGPAVTSVDKNHQAAKLGVAVGDHLVAVEGYPVPECDTTETGKKRFKAQITRWIKEAPRPIRLTFARLDATTSTDGGGASDAPRVPGEEQRAGSAFADDADLIADSPLPGDEADASWLEEVPVGDAEPRSSRLPEDPEQAAGPLADQLKACERSLAIMRAELQISKENGRSMERELEELRAQAAGSSTQESSNLEDTRLAQTEAQLRSASEQLAAVRGDLEDSKARVQAVQMQLAASRAECEALRSAAGAGEDMVREAFEDRETALQDAVERLRKDVSEAEANRREALEHASRERVLQEERIAELEKSILTKDAEATELLRRAVQAEQGCDDSLVQIQRLKSVHETESLARERQIHTLEHRIAEGEGREKKLLQDLAAARQELESAKAAQKSDEGLAKEATPLDADADLEAGAEQLSPDAGQLAEGPESGAENTSALQERVLYLEQRCATLQKKVNAQPIIYQTPKSAGAGTGHSQPRGPPSWEPLLKTVFGPRVAETAVMLYVLIDKVLRGFTERLLQSEAWLWLFYAHLVALYMVAGLTYAEVTPVVDPIESINARVDQGHETSKP